MNTLPVHIHIYTALTRRHCDSTQASRPRLKGREVTGSVWVHSVSFLQKQFTAAVSNTVRALKLDGLCSVRNRVVFSVKREKAVPFVCPQPT